jgi:ribosomal protein S18 acetylase RimI-like enzyme
LWGYAWGSRGETVVVVDDDQNGLIAGFGTWKHVDDESSVLHPRQIEIAWFAVHCDYQGVPFDEAHTVADVVYAEVERFAREHADSTPDMTITLECHAHNERALAFYRRCGFHLVGDPDPVIERDVYYRLVR